MGTTRTKKADREYRQFWKTQDLSICAFCKREKPLKVFKYWKVINNPFPWDRIAKEQHLIFPKRHVTDRELTKEEKKEYEKIKATYIEDLYEVIAEATDRKKSIPKHHHIHLIILKD